MRHSFVGRVSSAKTLWTATRLPFQPSILLQVAFISKSLNLRTLQTSQSRHDYPREGRFQQRSPQSPKSQRLRPQSEEPSNNDTPKPRSLLFLSTIVLVSMGGYWVGRMFAINDPFSKGELIAISSQLLGGPDIAEAKAQASFKTSKEVAEIPLFQSLRELRMTLESGEEVPLYLEWNAYEAWSEDPDRKDNMYSSGPLSKDGRAIMRQIVFRPQGVKPEDDHVLVLVKFGPGSFGYPGLVHHGVVATIFDEIMGRFANRALNKDSCVTANLDLTFLAEAIPNQWYLFTASRTWATHSTENKVYVTATMGFLNPLESYAPSSRPSCMASGLFVSPKGVETAPIPSNF